jgi:hypothetical protein
MFLNSGDELIDKGYLQNAKEILDNNPEYSFILPYLHPTMIVRKEVFNKIGGFKKEIKIAMDYDWIVRLDKEKLKGYYLNQDAPMKMDGRGKSVIREGEAIRECYNILNANNYLNFKNITGFIVRYFLYLGRNFMKAMGLDRLLISLKKIKHMR